MSRSWQAGYYQGTTLQLGCRRRPRWVRLDQLLDFCSNHMLLACGTCCLPVENPDTPDPMQRHDLRVPYGSRCFTVCNSKDLTHVAPHAVCVSQAGQHSCNAIDASGEILAGMRTFTLISVAMCLVLIASKRRTQRCTQISVSTKYAGDRTTASIPHLHSDPRQDKEQPEVLIMLGDRVAMSIPYLHSVPEGSGYSVQHIGCAHEQHFAQVHRYIQIVIQEA